MTLNQQKKVIKPIRFLLRIPVPWVFVLIYLVGLVFQFIFPFHFLSQETLFYVKIIGVVLFAIGAFLASWSLIIFHKASTTTTPGEKSAKLIVHGPYRFTRNPMYVSLLLAYLGEAAFLTQVWPVVILPLIVAYVNWIVIPLEEETLKKSFNEQYENYCKQVRRWI